MLLLSLMLLLTFLKPRSLTALRCWFAPESPQRTLLRPQQIGIEQKTRNVWTGFTSAVQMRQPVLASGRMNVLFGVLRVRYTRGPRRNPSWTPEIRTTLLNLQLAYRGL